MTKFRATEHLWLRDLRRHPDGEVRLYDNKRLISGTSVRQVLASLSERDMPAHEEALRADRAERELRTATRQLARLLEMVDAWDETFGDDMIRASVAAESVRRTIREDR